MGGYGNSGESRKADFMIKLSFYVPESHLDAVKEAVFEAGGGKIGNYDHCAWQVLGQGQFRPLAGSSPFVGRHGQTTYEPEYQVELVCNDEQIDGVVTALKAAHPYEEPAYAAWKLLSLS